MKFFAMLYEKLTKPKDTGWRICVHGEKCNEPDCTHKVPHERNTGCANVCWHSGEVCRMTDEPIKGCGGRP